MRRSGAPLRTSRFRAGRRTVIPRSDDHPRSRRVPKSGSRLVEAVLVGRRSTPRGRWCSPAGRPRRPATGARPQASRDRALQLRDAARRRTCRRRRSRPWKRSGWRITARRRAGQSRLDGVEHRRRLPSRRCVTPGIPRRRRRRRRRIPAGAGEDPLGAEGQQVGFVVDVEPGRERLGPGSRAEVLEGVDGVEQRGLRADGDQAGPPGAPSRRRGGRRARRHRGCDPPP